MTNPLGPPGPADVTCADCVWRKPGTRRSRCIRHAGKSVRPEWPACAAHLRDDALDCLSCGACCREAYHTVEVGPRDPFVRAHRELLHHTDGRFQVFDGTLVVDPFSQRLWFRGGGEPWQRSREEAAGP